MNILGGRHPELLPGDVEITSNHGNSPALLTAGFGNGGYGVTERFSTTMVSKIRK